MVSPKQKDLNSENHVSRNKTAKMGNDMSNMSCGENGGENSGENDSDRAPTQEGGEREVDGNEMLVERKTKPSKTTDDNNEKKRRNEEENDKCNSDCHGTNDEIGMHNEDVVLRNDECVKSKRLPKDANANILNTSSKHKKRKPNNQLREERAPALLHNQMEDFFLS